MDNRENVSCGSVADDITKFKDIVYNISDSVYKMLGEIRYPNTVSSFNVTSKLMEALWWMDQLASNLRHEQKRIDEAENANS